MSSGARKVRVRSLCGIHALFAHLEQHPGAAQARKVASNQCDDSVTCVTSMLEGEGLSVVEKCCPSYSHWRRGASLGAFNLSNVAMGSIDQSTILPMSAQYAVREAKTKQELDQIVDVIWAANYTPYEPFVQIFFPILGFTKAHREAAIIEAKERLWAQHQHDASSHWWYAFDTVTGKIVGSAQWVISRTNLFAAGIPTLTAPWWPEGESRRFCESILNQVYRPRASWMTRPHCALNWMAVHPACRQRGIGSLLMNAGIYQADELDLECWMESSSMGKPLYAKFGFQSLIKLAFDDDTLGASDEWRKCAHEMTPPPIFAMWRPKRTAAARAASKMEEIKMPWSLGVEK
ncbi:hypothetical protein T440DRAFT_489719 [Plenodomus tracheiphilus IPT5]|uniref:N-acetyltransferase domain-containing protein n=1 Tax=Plenodomus tracheiphilus IPT5 TaxID=1408161 RepID=A0A6A7B5E0_9PLEO|nr:hypothetical protein T440DRAFT_489719 [Plenodomus tracheiphilus IPT5]